MMSPTAASHDQSGAGLGVAVLVLNSFERTFHTVPQTCPPAVRVLVVLPRAWPAVPLPQRSAFLCPEAVFPSPLVYMAMSMGRVMRYSNTFKVQVKNFTVFSFFSVSCWCLGIVARL